MYTKLNPQPTLNANEIALLLDDGTIAAVAVIPTWLPNNAGVEFKGSSRAINEDGTDKVCPNGQLVQTAFNHLADAAQIADLGADAIAREMLYALIGEPQTTRDVGGQTLPLIGWHADVLSSASVKDAVANAAASEPLDAANLLGL